MSNDYNEDLKYRRPSCLPPETGATPRDCFVGPILEAMAEVDEDVETRRMVDEETLKRMHAGEIT